MLLMVNVSQPFSINHASFMSEYFQEYSETDIKIQYYSTDDKIRYS